MFYTYILHCKKQNKLYTGYTNNIDRRIKEHTLNQVHSTARLGNCELIFYEAFVCKEDAQRRESYLKTTKGKKALKLMLRAYLAPSSHEPE